MTDSNIYTYKIFNQLSEDNMLELKSYVEQCTDPEEFYGYTLELPEDCIPRTAFVGLNFVDNIYTLIVRESFTYHGDNQLYRALAQTGGIATRSWSEMETLLRALSLEEGSAYRKDIKPPVVMLEDLTDWNQVNIPTEKTIPTFEDINSTLKQKVIGQDEAVEAISYQIAHFLKKKNPRKPVSMLFSGLPGIGKSETAKAIADYLKETMGYDSVWTDLNNFNEAHSVSRLIGSPPGYVGYEDEPVFEAVTRNPYTLFIFDELDKAHPEVLKTFMAIMDEGRCASRKVNKDGSREYNFRHCIFFFTSNYNLEEKSSFTGIKQIGFRKPGETEFKDGAVKVNYEPEVATNEPIAKRIYKNNEKARKEFIRAGNLKEIASRFTAFINFKPLSKDAKIKILAKQILDTSHEYGINLSYIAPSIMQQMVNEATTEDSLTVRSFRSIIEGYLAPIFIQKEPSRNLYQLEGTLKEPYLILVSE